MATEQGHLDQERKNLQTTSNIPSEDNTSSDNDFFPSKITHKTLNYSFKIINNEAKEKSYTDLTVKYSYQSSWGHQYIFVFYDYDANSILSHPLKTRQSDEIIIVPAFKHYCCLKCYVPKTGNVRITDTVKIIPRNIPIPEATIDDHIKTTAFRCSFKSSSKFFDVRWRIRDVNVVLGFLVGNKDGFLLWFWSRLYRDIDGGRWTVLSLISVTKESYGFHKTFSGSNSADGVDVGLTPSEGTVDGVDVGLTPSEVSASNGI